jgi:hypothetical protein
MAALRSHHRSFAQCATVASVRHATASRQRFERGSGSGRAAAHVMVDIQRRATESSEPYVITALAQRWLGRFSHSAANAVAQLKS